MDLLRHLFSSSPPSYICMQKIELSEKNNRSHFRGRETYSGKLRPTHHQSLTFEQKSKNSKQKEFAFKISQKKVFIYWETYSGKLTFPLTISHSLLNKKTQSWYSDFAIKHFQKKVLLVGLYLYSKNWLTSSVTLLTKLMLLQATLGPSHDSAEESSPQAMLFLSDHPVSELL